MFEHLHVLSKKKWIGNIIYFLGYLYLSYWNHFFNKIPFFNIRHFILKYLYGLKFGLSNIHMGIIFFSPWKIKIGDNSILHFDCFLDGRGSIEIGNNVDISFGVKIFTEQHLPDSDIYETIIKKVVVHDYVSIGAYSIILPGVIIGKGAIIAAGSVVSKNIEPFTVVGGIPARFIKKRDCSPQYQLTYKRPFH